jgi:tRNA pseudouridine55 synthase
MNFREGEVLLINKPYRWTSFDVVAKVRNTVKKVDRGIKVGHAGTLDPLAEGLLILCTGKFTKKLAEYQAEEKAYEGIFTLGATTPSYDLETEIDQTFRTEHITEEAINATVAKLSGVIQQFPPKFSAIKIEGERLYEKARRGEEVELKSRTVEILEFKITSIQLPEVHFYIKCSKGTYIRSIAHEFGQLLNNGAHLSKLVRTESGHFQLKDAWELDTLLEKIRSYIPSNNEDLR